MDKYEDIYSSTPPAPPPKPGSHEVSRIGTPTAIQSPRHAPPLSDQLQYHQQQQQQPHSDLPEAAAGTIATATATEGGGGGGGGGSLAAAAQQAQIARPNTVPDPGDQWLPTFVEDKPCAISPMLPNLTYYISTRLPEKIYVLTTNQ